MFAVLLISTFFASSFGQVDWSYYGDTGPSEWSRLFPEFCALSSQSPINITTDETVYDPKLGALKFNGYNGMLRNSKIENTGRTVYIVPSAKESYTVEKGDLPNVYILQEIHFHWGKNDTLGAEHAINGHKYPLEGHFVHRNENYSTVEEAVKHADGLAVLAVFYEISLLPPRQAMTAITNALKDIRYAGDKRDFSLGTASVDSLLPPGITRHFYRYNGSLTTPICNEAVIWSVFPVTEPITELQMGEFRKLLASMEGEAEVPLVDNFRPVQPLNNRTVLRSRKVW